ncbi:hypothetical protein EV702DRAFT_1049051 [Suillus placidus]|uniref:Uncharacterized protein n=1 Tax=Suillus placidus TaxID=48579 RepID=A0A9P6ZNB9_9AGAM|nr:hypothetical protein EV702DRAFT_1049051 [Suillus placidus]
MTFAGYACVTTVTTDEDAGIKLKRRHDQSYHAVCQLIEQCRSKGGHRSLLDAGERQHNTIRQRKDTIDDFKVFDTANSLWGYWSRQKLARQPHEVTHTSPDTQRCTTQCKEYTISFDGKFCKVFDTSGLDDPQLGIKEYLESIENAYRLIKELVRRGGIDLLLFCVRAAGRVTAMLQSNFRLFLREEGSHCSRHHEPRKRAEDGGLIDGRHRVLYEESRITIRDLVKKFTADEQKQAWMRGDNLFVLLMRKLKELLVGSLHMKPKDLVPHLTKRCGVSREIAKQLVDMIKQGVVTVT